jgi:pre-mRNA-processing factor 17
MQGYMVAAYTVPAAEIRVINLQGQGFISSQGHTIAGYACQPNFSPDGRYVVSGDGEGRVWFWDWKTCKPYRTIKAHEGVCIDVEWHPLEASKLATCGWDGQIKYWD